MVFYLKINRDTGYTIRNLKRWLKIAAARKTKCFLICDNERLKENVVKAIDMESYSDLGVEWMESIRSKQALNLIGNMANERWKNAGLAHLTTFLHAEKQGYTSFWNIDADDTMMCIDQARAADCLEKAETYAEKNGIDIFSLDMWRSQSRGRSWSFGITYVRGDNDWEEIITRNFDYLGKTSRSFVNGVSPKNIDEFFAYIRKEDSRIRIETFCIKNLLFVHYSDDFLFQPIQSGIYTWKEDEIHFPILEYVYGAATLGRLAIAEDVVQFECGITEEEGRLYLAESANYTFESGNVLDAREYAPDIKKQLSKQLPGRIAKMLRRCDMGNECWLFGCNDFVAPVRDELKKRGISIRGILDNDKNKQDTEFAGLRVFAPGILTEDDSLQIDIIVLSRFYRDICFQLKRYGYRKEPYWLTDYRDILEQEV